ncbi:hypothetical protein ACFPRL_19360 [Pseudoclavibacter helvolus]
MWHCAAPAPGNSTVPQLLCAVLAAGLTAALARSQPVSDGFSRLVMGKFPPPVGETHHAGPAEPITGW